MLNTPNQVREYFADNGISIASWAAANSFSYNLVLRVLSGHTPVRGQSHRIAVKLGLKAGTIVDPTKIADCLSQHVA